MWDYFDFVNCGEKTCQLWVVSLIKEGIQDYIREEGVSEHKLECVLCL